MQVSVETLEGLEHKVTISVPKEDVEKEVTGRLRSLARKVKMDGFRPGNAPMHIVVKRYEDSVRHEVAKDLIEKTLVEALQQEKLIPAGSPKVEPLSLQKGEDFKYAAVFETMPVFNIFELNKAPVELIRSEVTDKDVQNMMQKLREQHASWFEVSHAAEKGNKVEIDFKGTLEGNTFEGGNAKGYELILGSGAMIPGFEEEIIGKKRGESFDIQVTFPKDYGHVDLANKEVSFNIQLNKVMESKLPELDEAFAHNFNIKTGGIEVLQKNVKDNMERELEKRVNLLNREKLFDKLLELNQFTLPNMLIDREIEHLKHEAYHRIFGNEHKENEQIPDFPRELFEDQAKRRVHLGLLFSDYVKKHNIVADRERVSYVIDKFSAAFDSPDEMRKLYQNNKDRRGEIEALVLEEMVAEKIAHDATVIYVEKECDLVMGSQKTTENKGE